MRSILTATPESFNGAIAMPAIRGTTDRTEIETLWTEDVSDYLAV